MALESIAKIYKLLHDYLFKLDEIEADINGLKEKIREAESDLDLIVDQLGLGLCGAINRLRDALRELGVADEYTDLIIRLAELEERFCR